MALVTHTIVCECADAEELVRALAQLNQDPRTEVNRVVEGLTVTVVIDEGEQVIP